MTEKSQTETAAVLVVGSCNYDLTIQADHLPAPSETLLGGACLGAPGGKGANQALGLLRLGGAVRFLARVGQDHYGEEIIGHLKEQGLDVSDIEVDDSAPTGVALVTVDRVGTRSIVVAPGANAELSTADVDRFLKDAPTGSVLLTQLETPVPTATHLMQLAKRRALTTVLHASPAVPFPLELLRLVDIVVLNQAELRQISGRSAQHLESAATAAQRLLEAGAGAVLVTMGQRGVLVSTREQCPHNRPGCEPARSNFVAGHKVRSVKNSTVASSAFVAGLTYQLAKSSWRPTTPLGEAVGFGLLAMAVSLSREGGQSSLPHASDVTDFAARLIEAPTDDAQVAEGERLGQLAAHAASIRRRIIRMLFAARSGHPGGSLSVVEVLSSLYFHAMVYNPQQPDWINRDRLVLSKGHAAPALYSTLIEAGFLDPELEGELRKLGSPLQGHPDRKRCPGVEMSTGSLGQGLSVANGMALAARQNNLGYRVYCILGDGEVQEGQIWEAAMTAAHNRLDNLCAIVDYNALQIDGSISQVKSPIEPLPDKWKAFGWHVINVDGHDLGELCKAFDEARAPRGLPTMIVAHTIKGHGVSFMEGVIEYHGSALGEQEVQRALAELEGDQ